MKFKVLCEHPVDTTDKNIMPTACATDCRVLVIDDSPDIATLVRAYSDREPIEVVIAETGEAGLERLREGRFDAVFMDFHLPDMTGADAVRKLRIWERQFKIPVAAVFAMTDLRDFQSSEQMLMAGCTALAGKPLSRNQFLAIAGRQRRRDTISLSKNSEKLQSV